jgi:arylsulfatase A-like enzyme
MIMIKKIIIRLLILVATVWLFFPRFSSQWNLKEDEGRLKGKDDYLKKTAQKSSANPNILIILADDLSRNDLALYDPVHGIAAPHIEELAAGGTLFTDASAGSPICSPSRAGMLTGRMQNRYGFDSQPMQIYPVFPAYYQSAQWFLDTDEMHQVPFGTYPYPWEKKKQGVPQSELMLPEILKSKGYDTALMGKWHLGYGESQHPNSRGFDQFYGFLEAFTYYDDPDKEEVVFIRHDLFWEKHIERMKRKGASAIQRNGKKIKEDRHLTDAITEETLAYIKNQQESAPEKPFFVYASYNAPHTPFQELKEYYDLYDYVDDPNRRIYLAMIHHFDQAVGELMDGLEEMGLRENTLILFASDNGGASYTLATENGDLAGGKMSQFQGGLEIPMIISWPGRVPEGKSFNEMVSLMDFFTTSLEATGLPLPTDRPYDGVDLIPYLTGQNNGLPHESLYWQSGFNHSLRRGIWKLMTDDHSGENRLYNLKDDRGEYHDVSEEFPQVLKEMIDLKNEYNSQCLPPLWPRVMDFDIEVHGRVYSFAT